MIMSAIADSPWPVMTIIEKIVDHQCGCNDITQSHDAKQIVRHSRTRSPPANGIAAGKLRRATNAIAIQIANSTTARMAKNGMFRYAWFSSVGSGVHG